MSNNIPTPKVCSLCNKEITGVGYDPQPFAGAVCCERCYKKEVLPALSAMTDIIALLAYHY